MSSNTQQISEKLEFVLRNGELKLEDGDSPDSTTPALITLSGWDKLRLQLGLVEDCFRVVENGDGGDNEQ